MSAVCKTTSGFTNDYPPETTPKIIDPGYHPPKKTKGPDTPPETNRKKKQAPKGNYIVFQLSIFITFAVSFSKMMGLRTGNMAVFSVHVIFRRRFQRNVNPSSKTQSESLDPRLETQKSMPQIPKWPMGFRRLTDINWHGRAGLVFQGLEGWKVCLGVGRMLLFLTLTHFFKEL